MKYAARIGLIVLLGALGAFEALFLAERTRGHEALAAERSLRATRATELLREELTRELDVAEARVEALETLPLLEEDGLLWFQDGLQRVPRLAGVLPLPVEGERALEMIRASVEGRESLRSDAGVSESSAVRRDAGEPLRGASIPEILRTTVARDAGAVISPGDSGTPGRDGASGLGASERDAGGTGTPRRDGASVDAGAVTTPSGSGTPSRDGASGPGASERDAGGTGTPGRDGSGDVGAVISPTAELLRTANGPGTPAEKVFRAWPWLERKEAAALCVRLQRASPKDTSLTAACQRGLSAKAVVVPPLADDIVTAFAENDGTRWLAVKRGTDVRGSQLDLGSTTARVKELLHRRAVLEEKDDAQVVDAQPLPSLAVLSPRLDEAETALISAFWLKTSLLIITALLGLAVVFLMRLAEARERQSLALQREFIATVSHELRTPLAGIRVLAETLERKLSADSAARDYPKRLVLAVDGLGFLVENILSFNRIEAGRLQPKKEPFALASLESMLREDIALMVERPVQLTCEGLSTLGTVSADVTLLRILVLNLLRNTWKYARPDNPTPHFTVTGRDDGTRVVLTFTDDGPGIAADAHERVFEPFHRQPGAESSNVRGSGLGLALSRRIAQLHGGTLRITSSSERGTTFELVLPRS
ncbi:MAG: ATP-binding protein [Archangium sp.]